MAVRAVKSIGLDVGGVDFLTDDITQSYKDIGGAIVEVNSAPGFRMHIAPSEGKPRDVATSVMDMLFPPGSPSCIPIAAITGTNGKTTTARMLSYIMKTSGNTVGMTSTDGVYIDGHLTVKGDMTGPVSSQMVLRDPSVDVAVMEVARGGMLKKGVGFPKCDVAACLNVSADHLGLRGIEACCHITFGESNSFLQHSTTGNFHHCYIYRWISEYHLRGNWTGHVTFYSQVTIYINPICGSHSHCIPAGLHDI
jgi:cyanophycin synthetase